MNVKRFVLFVVVFPLLVLGVGLTLCLRQKGFSPHKIASKLEYKEAWEVEALSEAEQLHLSKVVLSQPFYYLDGGQQCYAFVSEDQKYVLKFFKMHHLLPKTWLNRFPFSLFANYKFNHVDKKIQFLERTFNSYKLAYEHLKKETGLMLIHLNKTRHLKQSICLVGRHGEQYRVDLDGKEFVLQRKAEHLFPHLLELMQEQEDQRAHQCLRSLLKVVVARCQAKFSDQGIGIRYNYGFVDDQAVIIDCGQFVPDESLASPHNYLREILRVTDEINRWAAHYCPTLVPILQQEAQGWMNSTEAELAGPDLDSLLQAI